MWGKAYSVCEAAIVVPGDSSVSVPGDLARTDIAVGYIPEVIIPRCRLSKYFFQQKTLRSNSSDRLGLASMPRWREKYLR